MVFDKLLIALVVGFLLMKAKENFEDASEFREYLRSESPALSSDPKERFDRLVTALESFQGEAANLVFATTGSTVLDLDKPSDSEVYIKLVQAGLEIDMNLALLKQWNSVLTEGPDERGRGESDTGLSETQMAITNKLTDSVDQVVEKLLTNNGITREEFRTAAKEMNEELTSIRISVREIVVELSRQHYRRE